MSKTWRKIPKSVPRTRMMNAIVNEAVISAKSTITSAKRRRWTISERRIPAVESVSAPRFTSAR